MAFWPTIQTPLVSVGSKIAQRIAYVYFYFIYLFIGGGGILGMLIELNLVGCIFRGGILTELYGNL